MTKDLCRETYEELSTGRTRVRGVTGQRRQSAERGGLTDGILR